MENMWVKFQVNFLVLKTLSSSHVVTMVCTWLCFMLEYILHHHSTRVPHNLKPVLLLIKTL